MKELEHGKRGDDEPTWNYRPNRSELFDLAEGLADLPTDEMLIDWREANEYLQEQPDYEPDYMGDEE